MYANFAKEDKLILEKILKRKFKSVCEYARKRGIVRKWAEDNFYWKDFELEYLIKNFEIKEKEEILDNIKNKSWETICAKAYSLKLNRKSLIHEWNNERIEILKNLYPITSEEEICQILENSWGAIQGKANKLGLKRNFMQDVSWTEEKIEILKRLYWDSSWAVLFDALGTNNKTSITSIASKLNISRKRDWLDNEDKFLIDNYSKLSSSEIVKKLKRSLISIFSRAFKLGLRKRKLEDWAILSNNEILLLLKNKISEIGRTPQWRELTGLGLPSPPIFVRRFGSYQKALNLLGYTDGNALYGIGGFSKEGFWCKSQSEIRISNFLFDNNIIYSREKYYKEFFQN